MALPTSIETERTLYLQNILHSVPAEDLVNWPMPTRGDFTLIGKIIVHYSYRVSEGSKPDSSLRGKALSYRRRVFIPCQETKRFQENTR
jgi:hypothetical protein